MILFHLNHGKHNDRTSDGEYTSGKVKNPLHNFGGTDGFTKRVEGTLGPQRVRGRSNMQSLH